MFTIPSLAGLIAGIVSGVVIAGRRQGNGADRLHYGAVCGLIGFVLGVLLSIILPAPG